VPESEFLMIRRAGLAAVILLLLATASVSAAAKTVSIYSSYYSPAAVKVAMGGTVRWTNTTGATHNVTSDAFFLGSWFMPSTTVKPHTTSVALTFPEAGTFSYHDSTSAALRGTVKVPMTADASVVSVGSVVTVTMGTVPASAGGPVYHIAQARLNGGAWQNFATTSANTTGFHPTAVGKWELRTCLHHALGGTNSGWSPLLTITAV
jgi:plastocyanin